MENYFKIANIGQGTYGNVYLVKNKTSLNLYALKTVIYNKNEKKQSYNIENEIAILNSSDHPNIVKYIDSFVHKGKFCIVMELCDNGDIKSLLLRDKKQNKNINEETIWNWFFQIGNAIMYLHSKNIIHRDIKPENIFFNKSGQLKLGDFGISKILESSQDFAQTSLGTPYYLSPEICRGYPYNNKIDIWMLGCFLYESINFEKPFAAKNICNLMNSIINDKHKRNNNVYSEDLQSLIDVLLEKDPDKRPSITDVLQLPFVKSHYKKLSRTNNLIKNKNFLYKCNLQIEIDDLAPKFSNDYKFQSKMLLAESNYEIENKELENLKKNLIASSPLSNISKEIRYDTCAQISPVKNESPSLFGDRNQKNYTSNVNLLRFDKKCRNYLRTKSINEIKNLNYNVNSYEGEINFNNDNCSIYKNKSHNVLSEVKKRPFISPQSCFYLIKQKQNNFNKQNYSKVSNNINKTSDDNSLTFKSDQKSDLYYNNLDLIQDNSQYEKKHKNKKPKREILNEKSTINKINEISIMSYQSKDSLMDLLQKEIGIEKLNLLMESLNQSESHLEFCNNSEKITNICGLESLEITIQILKQILSSYNTPSNVSTSTQFSFQ